LANQWPKLFLKKIGRGRKTARKIALEDQIPRQIPRKFSLQFPLQAARPCGKPVGDVGGVGADEEAEGANKRWRKHLLRLQ
jgi:hypothetical protein